MPICECKSVHVDKIDSHVCQLKLPLVNSDGNNDECDDGNESLVDIQESESLVRNGSGSVQLKNSNISSMKEDVLYHLALGTGTHDFVKMFGDIKFVCMGGTPKRMENFAYFIMNEIDYNLPIGTHLLDITHNSHRFSMFKVGPVLSISHGMGTPSIGILLNEVIKLMYHAKVKDPIFFRIGTCGGIGVNPGTVVITENPVDGMLSPYYEIAVLGKKLRRPAILNKQLQKDLKSMAQSSDDYETVIGKTMCAEDFYEGQSRLDGAFCDYKEEEKMAYLQSLQEAGVVNIEMEGLAFAAFTHRAGITSAIVCVTIVNRLMGDQVMASKIVLEEWQKRPQILVSRYIKNYLQASSKISIR